MSNITLKIIKYEFNDTDVTSNFTFDLIIGDKNFCYFYLFKENPPEASFLRPKGSWP